VLDLFLVESKRQWLLFRRYPVEAFAGVAVFTILFVGLFTGSRFLAGQGASFGVRLDMVVAGYIIWLVTTGLFAAPGSQVTEDARTGIMEQLFVTPHNFAVYTAMRVSSGLLQHLLLIAVVTGIIYLITGTALDYRAVELLPFFAIILAATGLGLLVAAYAMLVKQVGAILMIGQFLLLAMVATPIQAYGAWGKWLAAIVPINPSAQLLQHQLATGSAGKALDMAISAGNGLVYFALGMVALHLAATQARRRATIGVF